MLKIKCRKCMQITEFKGLTKAVECCHCGENNLIEMGEFSSNIEQVKKYILAFAVSISIVLLMLALDLINIEEAVFWGLVSLSTLGILEGIHLGIARSMVGNFSAAANLNHFLLHQLVLFLLLILSIYKLFS